MEIEQFLYDLTESGEAIVAYTMTTRSGVKVQLCNMGASVLSLSMPSGRDIASGRCVMGLNGLRESCNESKGERFDERLWESWVETNRVIMSTALNLRGVDTQIEVVFDLDDEANFEITYQAFAAEDVEFDLTHALSIDLGDDMEVEINGGADEQPMTYAIDDARPSILVPVAQLRSAETKIEICSSQPLLYHNCEDGVIAPISAVDASLAANQRYIQKSLFRL